MAPFRDQRSIFEYENMKDLKEALSTAAREHIISGYPITRLEAMVLFGVQSLPGLITRMRQEGWVIKSKKVPFAKAIRRINKHAVLTPPENLPVRDIQITEFWVSK